MNDRAMGWVLMWGVAVAGCGPALGGDGVMSGSSSETGEDDPPCDSDDGCPDESSASAGSLDTTSGGEETDDDGAGDESSTGDDESTGGQEEPPPGACMLLDTEACDDGGERRCVYGEEIDDTWGVWTHCYQCMPHDTRQCGDDSQFQTCEGNIEPETQPNDDPPMWGRCWDLDDVECLPGSTDACPGNPRETMWCRIGDDGLPYWDMSCAKG